MTKLIYLDSSDFSDLSKPTDQLAADQKLVLDVLRGYRQDGSATFLLSATHLSEAVHATDNPAHKEAATRRAALMEELCSQPYLRFSHEVLRLEVERAVADHKSFGLTTAELFSGPNEWFGFYSPLEDRRSQVMEEFRKRSSHLPRRDRRRLMATWQLSKKSGRQNWRTLFNITDIPAEMRVFPFSLLNPNAIRDWLLGERTNEEFRSELLKIMNSPTALIRFVLDETKERHTIYSLLRNEGSNMHARTQARMQKIISDSTPLLAHVSEIELLKFFRKSLPRSLFYRTIVSSFSAKPLDAYSDEKIAELIGRCPAVLTFANLYMAYVYSLLAANIQSLKSGRFDIKAGKTSDFADMMHAVYAPYCDVFRGDSHISSLLKEDATVRPRIATKRNDLLTFLNRNAA